MPALLGSPEHDALLMALRDRVRAKIARDLARETAEAASLRETVVPVVAEVVARARAEGHCRRVWLFGSFAWGKPTADSDVDLLVEGDDSELAHRIGEATRRDVHALTLDDAPASLRQRCLAEGRPL